MSCVACEEYAKRITNILRDEDLKEKFEGLTGIAVVSNVFICDPCSFKLIDAITFRDKCVEVYNESNVKLEAMCQAESLEFSYSKEEQPEMIIEEHLEEHLMEQDNDPLYSETDNENCDDDIQNPRIRYRYTLKEKLNAIQVAENVGNRAAEKLLSIGESCIRKWRSQKEDILSEADLERSRLCRKKKSNESPPAGPFYVGLQTSASSNGVKSRKSYTLSQKLEAVAYAEGSGNRYAAKVFRIDESCIRKWRTQKELLIKINQERNTKRKPNLRFPEIEERLKEFVNQKIHQDGTLYIRPNEIKAESQRIAKELNMTNFKGTSSYIFKFMERYNIQSRRKTVKFTTQDKTE